MTAIRGDILLTCSSLCVAVACLLYAVPIPAATSYWATGFIAMCLAALGSDLLAPTLTLFTALALPTEDQALGGGVCNSVVQVGRVVALAVATAIQTAVQARSEGGGVGVSAGNEHYLKGLQAAQYFNMCLALVAALIVLVAFYGKKAIK